MSYEHPHVIREEPVAVAQGDAPQTRYVLREDGREYSVLYTHVTPWSSRDAWCSTCRSDHCWHALKVLMVTGTSEEYSRRTVT